MNPDRRAEIGPQNSLCAVLPRELRVSAFGSRLLLASLAASVGATALEIAQRFSAQIPVAQAADPTCRVGARIESYVYFDMAQIVPGVGKRHILDMGIDPRAGSAAGFVVEAVPVSYKKGDREKTGFRPLGSANIIRDQKNNVGRGEMEFTASCNTTAVTSEGKKELALRYKLISNLDPGNDQFEVVTPNKRRSVVAFGSEIKKAEDLLRINDIGIVAVKDLDARKIESIKNWLATQKPLVPTSPITLTASGFYTGEVRAAIERVIAEQIGKATSPLQKDLRDTNDVLRDIKTDLRGQKDNIDELSKRTKSLEETQGRTEKELAEIKRRLPAAPVPRPGEGINLPINLPVVGDIVQAGGLVLNLPAKVVDQFTEPDTEQPIRAGIDVLGWLLLLSPNKLFGLGWPRTLVYRTGRYPFRLGIAGWRRLRGNPFVRPAWA